MNSSPKSPHLPPEPSPEPLLVRDAGVPYRPGPADDPFERWLELMEVVEALCPRWPARGPRPVYRDMKL